MASAARSQDTPHIPVLIAPLVAAAAPVRGLWIDGTFGAGGYARHLLEAGAERLIGIDRDPMAIGMAAGMRADWGDRLELHLGTFDRMDSLAQAADGVVLDLGVSSMQLDQAPRGFSFMSDGPLDMRMSQKGVSAADLVNGGSEAELADILFQYGEERASRRIAAAIVAARATAPILTTRHLVGIIETCLPRPKPGQSHPATRSFQALRIAVNNEFGQLIAGLEAAERVLRPGGTLAVVSFHSLEDRIVKRFLTQRAGGGGRANRYAPDQAEDAPTFERPAKAVRADADELAANPRARSARLRMARRSEAPAREVGRDNLGLPRLALQEGKG